MRYKEKDNIEHSHSIRYTIKRIVKETEELMDEQKHLKNEQGEPGNKTEKSEYLFMQETIKDENSRGKKYRKDLLRIAGLGVAFGVCACISFSALRPWLDEKFPGDSQEVVIPEEKEEEKSDETTADTGNDSTVQTLGIDSYRELQKAMNSVASEAAKSVVEVIGISGEQDWTEESYDNKNSVSGLIIADNGQELLIYGKTSILRDTKEIHIRFADGTTKQASVKKKDESLGFAIYAVAKSSIAQSTWQQISIATLGSSGSVQKGDAAVVLGKPFGYAGAVGFGTIASSRNELDGDDGSYPLLCTDIGAAEDGTGVIINLSGEVVGIIDQGISGNSSKEMVTGYGISGLKSEIELLSNGQAVPYIGIRGLDVTAEIEAQGIPEGVYVRTVETDSPAMAAGIQSGDIITEAAGKKITSLSAYQSVLRDQKRGSKIRLKGQRQGSGGYVDISFDVTVGSKE